MRYSPYLFTAVSLLSSLFCNGFIPVLQQSFAPISAKKSRQTPSTVLMDQMSREEMMERNNARTDVQNLLTQRSIQSFMFLTSECRDPHTGKWIEDYLGSQNLLQFHGTGAFNIEKFPSWDSTLFGMMEQPKDVVIVSAKRRGKGHGGWSKNNPYMEDRYVEFEIDIDPVSITSRIMSVREQIAQEWVNDFNILRDANDQILGSYFAKVKEERDREGCDPTGANMDDPSCVDMNKVAFERTAVNILNNHTAFQVGASSPFRKGNFDLLYNLCTQESLHRMLRDLRDSGSESEISYTWLRDFYIDRVGQYFDGDQRYGRADDFVEEILLSSPSVQYTEDGRMGLADPLGLAEKLIQKRNDVVDEWQEAMKEIPVYHTVLRKALLEKQMQAWGSSPGMGQSSFE